MFDGLPERESKELCARWINGEFDHTHLEPAPQSLTWGALVSTEQVRKDIDTEIAKMMSIPKFTQEEVKAYCKIKTEIDRINKEAEELNK